MAAADSGMKLIGDNKRYGDGFTKDLFEQYKLYVDSAQKISERRVSANNYLLTVNAFLVTLYGLALARDYKDHWMTLVPVAGLLVSMTWHEIIKSYRDLNTVKFKIIHELEQQMPAALFAYEWKLLDDGKGDTYLPLSHLEGRVPLVFVVLYVLLIIVGLLVLT